MIVGRLPADVHIFQKPIVKNTKPNVKTAGYVKVNILNRLSTPQVMNTATKKAYFASVTI